MTIQPSAVEALQSLFLGFAFAGLLAALLVTDPWLTLLLICAIYVALIPFGIMSYAKVMRQRESAKVVSTTA